MKGLYPIVFATGACIQSIRRIREAGPQYRFFLGAPMLTTVSKSEIRGKPMNVRILVVDDNAKVRDGLRLLLQSHADWEVCGEATDGIEAIEKYRELRPDLLIVDVSMPRMNGLDASLEILRLSPKILILLYTSYLTAQLIDVAHKAGIRGTVSKDAMHLVVVGLEALLRGEEYRGPPN
jgi:DNA-binding NarL/FixJ family response regulator